MRTVARVVAQMIGLGLGLWLSFGLWTSVMTSSVLLPTLLILATGYLSAWLAGAVYDLLERTFARTPG